MHESNLKESRSKHFDDVVITLYLRVTIGSINYKKNLFQYLSQILFLTRGYENNSK